MGLNNKGWSFSFFIIVGAIFLLLLIFVSIRIRNMTHQAKKDNKNDSVKTKENTTINDGLYTSLEQVLKRAGESYSVYHTALIDNTTDHLIVSFYTLKEEGFIESLADPDGSGDCDGYVFIKNDYSINPYIKCHNYETLNYSLWVN